MRSDIRLIPEYESDGILFCPPSNSYMNRKDFENVYNKVFKEISKEIPALNIGELNMPYPDIWARDFSPIKGIKYNGEFIYIGFTYKPSYIQESEKEYIKLGNDFMEKYSEMKNITYIKPNLILDGGNICHNGKICIITERVLQDNPKYSINDIKQNIQNFGIDKLIIIPAEPGDVTGHTDGTIRFLDRNTLAIAKYSEGMFELNNYLKEIKRQMIVEIDEDIDFIEISNEDPENEYHEGIPSCVGNYVNFILTKSHIILPKYSNSNLEILEQNRNNLSITGKKVLILNQDIGNL